MKQYAKFQLVFLFFVAFSLLFSLPAQGHQMTISEIEYEVEVLGDDILACEEECDRLDLEISDLEKRGEDPRDAYDFIVNDWDCDKKPKLNELEKELNKLANTGANVTVPEDERKKIEELKIKLDELEERNDNLQKRRKEFEARIKKLKEAARFTVHSELASEINKVVKPVLEKGLGKLEDRIVVDEEKRGIHVISIEYWMEEGRLLDDNWCPKTVKDLRLAGINATVVGNSVRADGQKIAGRVVNSFQIVTAQDIEQEALAVRTVMALTISVLQKK